VPRQRASQRSKCPRRSRTFPWSWACGRKAPPP
jgi:hypothetical protein